MLLALSALALSAPAEHAYILDNLPEDLTLVYDDILEEAIARAPADASAIAVYARDNRGALLPLERFLPAPPPIPQKPGETLRSMPVDLPGATTGSLSEKAVYLSQCHGWIWYDSLGRFSTQRGEVYDTVEDFHNPEALNQYLTAYLENAGASVFTVKERDMNPEEAWVDNGNPGYREEGSGFVDGATGWGDSGVLPYGENPFDQGTTRSFPSNGGGKVTWTPEVPEDGYYAVYVSWSGENNAETTAHYRLTHPGGTIDRYFDQRDHGFTWQYVETLWLPEGNSGFKVELIADSANSGRLVNADAVRIGGGTAIVSRHSATSTRPRWEEGAIQGTQFNGAPTTIYDPYSDGLGSDPASRSRWAAWEHPVGEDAVYVSWHSNAFNGTARGTSTYTYDGSAVSGSVDLADYVQDELISAARAWDSTWQDRGLKVANFSEVHPSNNPETPAVLIEHGFHDNASDVVWIKHPEFRRDSARAVYRGIVAYFADKAGTTPHYLPEPPISVKLTATGGALVANWSPGPAGAPAGDAATSYIVYTSRDGRSWDNGAVVSATSYTLPSSTGPEAYVRVAAVNAGGSSFPSEVVGARRAASDQRVPVLVVSAFDRLDSGTLNWESTSIGEVARMDLRRMNAYDTSVATGRALAASDYPFSTTSDEAFSNIDLDPYDLVVWVAGEESTANESISTAQQTRLRGFVEGGGALWVSGSEVLWDLDYRGSTDDKAFVNEVLGVAMASDAAGSTAVTGEGLLRSVGAMNYGVDDGAPYPVEWADTLTAQGTVLARYGDGAIAAALNGLVVHFGFPFETIGAEATREAVVAALLPALVPDYTPQPWEESDTDTDTDTDADADTDTDTDADTDADTGEPDGRTGMGGLGGCGCATPGPVGGVWALGALAMLWVRRRRALVS